MFTISDIDHIDQSECLRIRYSIPIGQLIEELILRNWSEEMKTWANEWVKYFRNAFIAATVVIPVLCYSSGVCNEQSKAGIEPTTFEMLPASWATR